MPLLIDGHNLIGQLPDIDLSDPDKEAKLIMRLRSYCARARKSGTVIFDRGLPGGRSQWSNRDLKVFFASGNTDADHMIIRRIERARDPKGLIVVSSDGRIRQAAQRHGAQIRSVQTFAKALRQGPVMDAQARERGLSADEVDEWLALFEDKQDEE